MELKFTISLMLTGLLAVVLDKLKFVSESLDAVSFPHHQNPLELVVVVVIAALGHLLCLTLCNTLDCSPPDPLVHGFFRKNIDVGCHFLLQAIFLTQGSNLNLLCLLGCRQMLYPLCHQGSSGTGSVQSLSRV